jgi:hypothetical protein
MFITLSAYAQNTYDRLSVVEEFTSATCGPCVAASEAMKEVVKPSNNVVSVRFHMYWPAPNDPWNLDNPTENESRRGYYGVSGIPNGFLNGVTAPVTSAANLLAAINADNAKKSPIKVEVSEVGTANGGDVTVKVTSNIALGPAYKLHVAVVSYHTLMPDLPSTLSGSNGEDEFYDAMNKMLPNANGTTLNIAAGANQTFNFSYLKKEAETWPTGQQYIVAYVQNTGTKEVLNAGTNLNIVYANASVMGNIFEWIPRSEQKTRDVTVSNPTNEEMLVTFAIANQADLNAAQWQVSLSADEATIPAGGSATVKVTSTSINRAFFAPIEFTVTPVVASGISQASSAIFGYLTEDSKIAIYYGATSGAVGNYIPALETTHNTDVVYVPYITEFNTSFPPETFDAAIFPIGIDGRFNIVNFIPAIEQMLDNGKACWLSAPMGISVSYNDGNQQFPGYPEAKAFFQNRIGLGLLNSKQRNDGTYYTSFGVKGVAGDPIGGNFTATANSPTQQWPFAMAVQDLMTIGGNSVAKSWIFADNTSANISGIRWQDPNTQAKFVFTTFGAEHLSTANTRKDGVQRVLDWLLEGAVVNTPEITLSTKSIAFGNVQVGANSTKQFVILNSGSADLVINSIELNGVDAVYFDITSGQPAANPITVAPNGSHTVQIQFAPTVAKSNYMASVIIGANAAADDISLSGAGVVSSVETEVASETGAVGLKLIGNNPITDASSVEVRATSGVTVTVVDAQGRTVATMFNGSVDGTTVLPIRNSNLSNGTYMIVATNGTEQARLSVVVAK